MGSRMSDREERLRPIVDRYRNAKFEWGVHDCALFAARCFDVQLGTNFESRILALNYHSSLSALRIIEREGGWEAFITRMIGRPPVESSGLVFGDAVLGRANGPLALGICDDDYFMAPAEQGLAWLPMSRAIKGWPCRR